MSETISRPLSWQALLALMLGMFAITVGYGIVLPILPFMIAPLTGGVWAAALSWHTGLLTGTYILAVFIFAPLWGKASDRWGRRPVILLGLTGFAATMALFAFVESLLLIYAGRFLAGVFAAAMTPVAYAVVGDHAPSKEWRARRFALINVAITTGFFGGPLLGGLALRAASAFVPGMSESAFPIPFLAAAGIAVLATLMIRAFVPSAGQWKKRQLATAEDRRDRAVKSRLWVISFVTALAIGAFEVGLALRGKQVLGMDATSIGMMFAECSLVMFVAQALVFSPLIKPEVTRWFLTPGLAILAIGLVVVPVTDTSITMSIAVALIAASAGVLSPIATYWVSLGAGDTQGADLGRMTAASSLGQALGSAGAGLLFEIPLLPGASFTLTALIVLAGLLATFRLPWLLAPASAADQRTTEPSR